MLINIALKVGIFPEAEGRGKYSLPRAQYLSIFHKEGLNIYFITQAKFIQLCKHTSTPKQRHFGLLDNSGPIQAELIYSSIMLLSYTHTQKAHTYLEGCDKTVTNTLHGTNFQAPNSRNRLV